MNKKNHFDYISTYQKDYTWPYVPSICRTQPPTKIKPIVVKGCTCIDSRRVRNKEGWDGNLEECLNWSQIGPMGRLLEPKIYPKIDQVPEADSIVTRFDPQLPSICLKEEYPDLYGYTALKDSLPKEPITRVDADRMKTTYQADYSDPAAARMTQRDMAMTVIDTNARGQCRMPIKIIIEADCPPHCYLPSSICTSVWKRDHKRKNGSRREKKCDDVERRQMSLPSWKSEYQDSISKIGHAIMRAKLHRAKRKALPVQYQYSTTSS
ncbi:uncharacterized protein LOC112463382 [Temnothorax curvispinosus]|uniref:Uncharacterized protein LOC112463382 n=1 Tax=Temnothorax curvispinosus TaxID=300111 RepID=A0A6J1QSU8_9HYME|nr:uncharacterized protein LOC112463382 [Temnothorax curvispinosus]